ncbi:excinuclease ABC subunit UvrC [Ignatzschineria rhizosphaerae]|uniref:UvrABC system protein C n=1 Tax=Ignatzschineria rhizosphaerae TaxID=2923279 RepID=A0ABY3X011_9GAMM|nr:excinuclease ABC subunit UvrC [Ignatzschineria rhizosphaerae]UNM96194.1 excinuclease ABC subunit UvrC [Ignatzschineria rhizosphaerae]
MTQQDSVKFDANDFLKHAPLMPGVYMMRDINHDVIYVGKAKNLKNRLSSYFKTKQLPPKTQALVANIASIETTITTTEREALLLESNLIKEYRPRYNVRLIDDKSYPYIYVSDHPFPRFSFYRGARKRKGRMFGPFPSSGAVRETLNLMAKVFRIRECEDSFFSHRTRPCLQYQIQRCSGPCVDKISRKEYLETVDEAMLFLRGDSQKLVDLLIAKMTLYSQDLQFEKAGEIRDQIQYIREIQGSNMMEENRDSLDIHALYTSAEIVNVEVMMIRDGRVLGTRAYFPKVPKDTPNEEIMSAFIMQYYGEHRQPPRNIIINTELSKEEETWLLLALSQSVDYQVQLQYPQNIRGRKRQWLNLVESNARHSVEIKLASRAQVEDRLFSLNTILGFEKNIQRIECFDISHSFGERTVASNVVYTPEGFTKKFYRRFNIEGVTAGDDYEAMRQVLTRRFKGKDPAQDPQGFPDLLLIDGGKGQLQVAIEVLDALGLSALPLMSISEGEGKVRGKDIIWMRDKAPLPLDSSSPAFHLLTQIRDEAHRFAIEGHRTRRDKMRRRSVLEDIPGIGETRRTALLTHFGGLESLKNAAVSDIAKVPGISQKLAEVVYQGLRDIN